MIIGLNMKNCISLAKYQVHAMHSCHSKKKKKDATCNENDNLYPCTIFYAVFKANSKILRNCLHTENNLF